MIRHLNLGPLECSTLLITRLTVNETSGLPQIPAQPIGYGDAEELLATLGGPEVPADWRGTIPGLTYRLGPGPDQQHAGWKVRMVVNNYLEDRTSDNVIGVIHGSEEPDRQGQPLQWGRKSETIWHKNGAFSGYLSPQVSLQHTCCNAAECRVQAHCTEILINATLKLEWLIVVGQVCDHL